MDTSDPTVLPSPASDAAAAPLPPGQPPPLPPPPGSFDAAVEPARPRRRRRWWIPFTVLGVGLVVAVVVAAFVQVDYYAIAPGDAQPTQPRITVTGPQTYPSTGQVLFVTVSVPHLTALGWVVARLDPNTELLSKRDILGDKTPSEDRQENLRLMGYSKDFATYVALTKLGYPVTVKDGGVVVTEVAKDVPAATVLQKGDIIVEMAGKAIEVDDDLRQVTSAHKPGDVLPTTVKRKGVDTKVDVKLASRPDGTAYIGIGTGVPDTISFTFPFPVEINSGQVGGPSAGLSFTLALLDKLTPGSISGGNEVAATGTMDMNGNVGPIGGLAQKTVAVLRTGAKVFMVPMEEVKQAVDAAKGTNLRIVGVSTLDDALRTLAGLGGNALELGTPGKDYKA